GRPAGPPLEQFPRLRRPDLFEHPHRPQVPQPPAGREPRDDPAQDALGPPAELGRRLPAEPLAEGRHRQLAQRRQVGRRPPPGGSGAGGVGAVTSQSVTAPSVPAVASSRPSGENATHSGVFSGSRNRRSSRPVATSQTRTYPSRGWSADPAFRPPSSTYTGPS